MALKENPEAQEEYRILETPMLDLKEGEATGEVDGDATEATILGTIASDTNPTVFPGIMVASLTAENEAPASTAEFFIMDSENSTPRSAAPAPLTPR